VLWHSCMLLMIPQQPHPVLDVALHVAEMVVLMSATPYEPSRWLLTRVFTPV
jgi:hypothetical protein